MRYSCLAILGLVGLASCANVPELQLPEKGVTVHQILQRIKCELIDARKQYRQLTTGNWIALGTLTVQVDDEGSLAAATSFINPITASTSFAFNAGGAITADRERIYSENFEIEIATLKDKPDYCDDHFGNPLLGDLGIAETIDIGLRSLKPGGPVDYQVAASNGAFGETVQFILTATLTGIGPTWTLVRFKGPTGNLAGAFRKDTNKLLISFAPKSGHAAPAAALLGGPVAAPAENAAASNNLLMLIQSSRSGSGGL